MTERKTAKYNYRFCERCQIPYMTVVNILFSDARGYAYITTIYCFSGLSFNIAHSIRVWFTLRQYDELFRKQAKFRVLSLPRQRRIAVLIIFQGHVHIVAIDCVLGGIRRFPESRVFHVLRVSKREHVSLILRLIAFYLWTRECMYIRIRLVNNRIRFQRSTFGEKALFVKPFNLSGGTRFSNCI